MRRIGTLRTAPGRTGLRMLAVGAALALVLAACGGDDDSSSNASATTGAKETTTAAASDANATVKVATTDVGKTLVTANGMTLYALEKDSKNTSTCTGGCATAWPPLVVTGKVVVGQGPRRRRLRDVHAHRQRHDTGVRVRRAALHVQRRQGARRHQRQDHPQLVRGRRQRQADGRRGRGHDRSDHEQLRVTERGRGRRRSSPAPRRRPRPQCAAPIPR